MSRRAEKKKVGNKINSPQSTPLKNNIENLHAFIAENNFSNESELKTLLEGATGKTVDQIMAEKVGDDRLQEPQNKANSLIDQAYGLPYTTGKPLVEQALAIDPLNADAYIYLADNQRRPEKAIELYRKAVEVGKATIGDADFKTAKGHFWGLPKTRPYMRAKACLAEILYFADQKEEAVKHYAELINLNPKDNQGIHLKLSTYLIELNKYSEYEKLHRLFKDDVDAGWNYDYVLYLYKQQGPTSKPALKALKKAHQYNPYILDYLLGFIKLPKDIPDFAEPGEKNEAVIYIYHAGMIWSETHGALDWLGDFKEGIGD